jgi:hypothetical protein
MNFIKHCLQFLTCNWHVLRRSYFYKITLYVSGAFKISIKLMGESKEAGLGLKFPQGGGGHQREGVS